MYSVSDSGSLARRWGSVWTLPQGVAKYALNEVPESALALTALSLANERPTVLAVLPNQHLLDEFVCDLKAFRDKSDAELLVFPMESQDREDPDASGGRIEVARRLAGQGETTKPCLVATCIQALMQPVADPVTTAAKTRVLGLGDDCDPEELTGFLIEVGYDRVPEVVGKRQFAVKGGLVDVWPLTARLPYRIETAADEVESLRSFNPADQLSAGRHREVRLPPAVSQRRSTALCSLLAAGSAVLWVNRGEIEDHAAAFAENASVIRSLLLETQQSRLDEPGDLQQLATGEALADDWQPLELPVVPLELTVPADMRSPDLLAERRHAILAGLEQRVKEEGLEAQIWLDTEGTREHLAAEVGESQLQLRVAPLGGGFELPALRLVIVAQPDLYGRAKRATARRAAQAEAAPVTGEQLVSLEHISVGDLVVHAEHGIGRYLGMTEIVSDGKRSEVLTIEYDQEAKLHVPVTHAHLLARYVGVGGSVRLHRLGGRRWSSDRAAAEQAVQDLAAVMLEVQARRSLQPGHAFEAETPWLHEFEASFPYAETADQARCIVEVKRDMYAPQPMDRLICGDAGYGKTEVALRAAFIAAMQGKQVALLVPTTVLAQQHYDTFLERMSPYPLRIAMHSRFCSRAQRLKALEGAADGTVDILIGTHGLLSPNVRFHDLGLVIVDEEQRFGVRHKEHLKSLRALVDILTLSATPIPRTLQLGLTGVRDLSLLQTPPQERVATETRVSRDSDELVRTAIERELDRGGQVFFLYNRILTIERMLERLQQLVPRARIAIGHGQMPAGQIEAVMRDFTAGKYDVLLCTTIIESGVDIPRANTIIVDRADRFGIADLYQLRGRVGRGSWRGYALFLIPESGVIDADARQRLQALRQHAGTGAGFQLAMRDLGIRGAGSLLGAAQSGHIAAVGFTLYCQLLRQSVARLKGEPPPRLANVILRLDLMDLSPGTADADRAACFPYGYIDEEPQRIAAYRRLAECVTLSEIDALKSEFQDRYGSPPRAAERLFRVAQLRVRAAGAGIQRIEVQQGEVRLFRDGAPWRRRGNLPLITTKSVDAQLKALTQLVRIMR